jgi:hypothetical protein
MVVWRERQSRFVSKEFSRVDHRHRWCTAKAAGAVKASSSGFVFGDGGRRALARSALVEETGGALSTRHFAHARCRLRKKEASGRAFVLDIEVPLHGRLTKPQGNERCATAKREDTSEKIQEDASGLNGRAARSYGDGEGKFGGFLDISSVSSHSNPVAPAI